MTRLILLVLTVLLIPFLPDAVAAQEEPDSIELDASYKNRRIEIERADGNYRMTLQWRFQFRTSTGFDAPPRSVSGLEAAEGLSYRVRRARLKVGGHAYRPWIEYYLEHDFPSSRMLDWRVTVGRPEFQVRVGQWKVNYSRERVQSSGEQTFVERSIVNRAFTLDRQVGVMAFGHLFEGSPADLRYYVGSFTGTGAGASQNDDDAPMYLGRLEWQPLGTDPGMSGGDLGRRTSPALTIAGGWATNRSPFTRFSGSGGGQMDGFTEAGAGQYRLRQAMFETAFKYRGFSFQHETHVKQVEDLTTSVETDYDGTFVQAAFFPSEIFDAPEPLEVGARWAKVSGGPATFDRDMREVTGVLNWYFADHKNKLTFDVSRVSVEGVGEADRWRSRLQWDISF